MEISIFCQYFGGIQKSPDNSWIPQEFYVDYCKAWNDAMIHLFLLLKLFYFLCIYFTLLYVGPSLVNSTEFETKILYTYRTITSSQRY